MALGNSYSMASAYAYRISYSGSEGSAQWLGKVFENVVAFHTYMAERVLARLYDLEVVEPLEKKMLSMSATSMAKERVKRLMRTAPENRAWLIGEALAACLLADDGTRKVYWP